MLKLSRHQQGALACLNNDGAASAYELKVGLNTLNGLSVRGLARMHGSLGNLFFPRNAKWEITDAGREVLARARATAKGE